MRDLLHFDSMITPKIVTLIYWLALALIALGGLFTLVAGQGGFGVRLITVIIGVPLAALGARIYCELIMVLFKINENIQRLADRS
ncbi:MAG: DUF4282 domain-containing protein [Xanthomonadales bacterium]|nr:DUF4282 domain-containing protein [Xanthomonadales bacterium]